MFDVEKSIANAEEEFKRMADYVRTEAQSQDAYAVERRLFDESRRLCLHLLCAYFEQKAGARVGQAVETGAGAIRRRPCRRRV